MGEHQKVFFNFSIAHGDRLIPAPTGGEQTISCELPSVPMPFEIYVVPQPGQNVTLSDIISFMKKEGVAIYKFLERSEIVDKIPEIHLAKHRKRP